MPNQFIARNGVIAKSDTTISGSLIVTGSDITLNGVSIILANQTSSLTALSSSFASTASSADNFLVRGTLTAQTINVQTITSSIEFNTGSTRNGTLLSHTHEFTGSVGITGSLTIAGNILPTLGSTYNIGSGGSPFRDGLFSNIVYAGTLYGYTAGLNLGRNGVTGMRIHSTTNNIQLQDGGTFTDNGYRLQVNGSGSASGSLFVSGSSVFSGSITSTIGFTVGEGTQTPDASGTITIRKGVAFAGLDLMSARTSGNIGGIRFFDSTNVIKSTIVSEVDGSLVFANNNIERLRISPTGSVGIGTGVLTGFSLHVGKNITGGTVTYGIAQTGQIQSDVTNTVYGALNQLNTQATAFTLSNYYHFTATQGTIGAGSAITSQAGFIVLSNLTGATNNFGFRGQIPAGTGDWNIYMDGTANNYLAGNLGIGPGKTVPTVALDISGSALVTGSLGVSGSSVFNGTATIVSASLNYQQNLAVTTGSFQSIVSVATGSFRAAIFDYVTFSGSVARAGTLYSTWGGSSVEWFENYTADVNGSTAPVTLQAALSGGNIQLQAGISGSAWAVRSLVRLL